MPDANSTEINPNATNPVVIDMPEHNPGQMGGTMRLGKRNTVFAANTPSILRQLYSKKDSIAERHRHRYEVNPRYVPDLEAAGMKFVGHDEDKVRMEMMELDGHPFYVAVQFHPEYLSRPLKPSPPFLGFILASCNKLQSYLHRGCRLSPRELSDDDSEDDSVLPLKLAENLNKSTRSSEDEAVNSEPIEVISVPLLNLNLKPSSNV